MSRPRLNWPDAQLREILGAIVARDRDFPLDNARFLDSLVDDVRAVTGRLYGATTYARLLRDLSAMTGVTRRPSTTTIQKAIARAQALAPIHVGQTDGAGSALSDAHMVRRSLEPVMRDAIAPLMAQMSARLATQMERLDDVREGDTVAARTEPGLRLQLAEASLADAHARVGLLEQDNARLRRDLGQAEMRASIAETRIAGLLDELHQAITNAGSGSAALAKVADQLQGTERFLKAQNDAVRLQASSEAEALRHQVTQLRERVDHLLLENDQYRRTLAVQRSARSQH
ncbi:hypothetical protein [Paraburkholderia terricola]|uniref:Uncharacterized protein YceH (UPF0502 family) n=1 Tax=Paraburkholderia terricola TaxID=169427 RepID=A0ABU1M233_9BURK|nr:hypothetical protein [Paraburkholderia terricola]MDR6413058.1 uncharacterized protein YceH (UPF0502 family) [Paraburkholderia terricola]MDR6485204.1 uncharacterized protein YceH (UPF0502 family) [Paraburkholderia terricola]